MNYNRILALVTAASVILCAAVIIAYPDGDADSFIILHTNDSHCHYDGESIGMIDTAIIGYIKDLGTIQESSVIGGRLVTA